ncbi:MAG: hypothetical protein E6J07_09925 [Chloroflexi bacterium]|nr:MAG: hypothetical protein E6J07_09925 [Chloroflexota bacterium]
MARKSSRRTVTPARPSTAPANVADREGDKAQGSIRHVVATDGPSLDPTPDSLLACLAKGKQGFWLDIENPGDDDYELLEKTFGFHPLTLEDIRHQNQRPKVDEYPGYAFVVLFTAELEGKRAQVREHHLYVSPQYLVSVHADQGQPRPHPAEPPVPLLPGCRPARRCALPRARAARRCHGRAGGPNHRSA